jgi:hypothetical protein
MILGPASMRLYMSCISSLDRLYINSISPLAFILVPCGSRLSRLAILILPFKSAFAQLWHKGFRNGR